MAKPASAAAGARQASSVLIRCLAPQRHVSPSPGAAASPSAAPSAAQAAASLARAAAEPAAAAPAGTEAAAAAATAAYHATRGAAAGGAVPVPCAQDAFSAPHWQQQQHHQHQHQHQQQLQRQQQQRHQRRRRQAASRPTDNLFQGNNRSCNWPAGQLLPKAQCALRVLFPGALPWDDVRVAVQVSASSSMWSMHRHEMSRSSSNSTACLHATQGLMQAIQSPSLLSSLALSSSLAAFHTSTGAAVSASHPRESEAAAQQQQQQQQKQKQQQQQQQQQQEQKEQEQQQQQRQQQEAGLPAAERCKNLLVANWRAQLTTLTASGGPSPSKRVTGSLVRFSLVDGQPVVWLPPRDPHVANLVMDERGSLLVGGTDPPALVHALARANKFLPRAIFMGDLLAVEGAEVAYMRRRAESQAASAQAAAAHTAQALLDGLKGQSRPSKEQQHQQVQLKQRKQETAAPETAAGLSIGAHWTPFRLESRTCQLVQVHGERLTVPASDIAGAAADPLAPGLPALLDAANQSPQLRRALVLFCAAYMGVRVTAQDAYLLSADRRGFNIMAQIDGGGDNAIGASCSIGDNPPYASGGIGGAPSGSWESESGSSMWREFRFQFQSEVADAYSFGALLASMEEEVQCGA